MPSFLQNPSTLKFLFRSILQVSFLVLPIWLVLQGLQYQSLQISQFLFDAKAIGLYNFRMSPLHPESVFGLHFRKCWYWAASFSLHSLWWLLYFILHDIYAYFNWFCTSYVFFLIHIFGFISVELYYWLLMPNSQWLNSIQVYFYLKSSNSGVLVRDAQLGHSAPISDTGPHTFSLIMTQLS